MSVHSDRKAVTVSTLHKLKKSGEKIACLTAYDASFGWVLDQAGVDITLIGDSLGMVVQGHETTVPVSVDDIVYHSRAVASKTTRALLMADMPFMSYSSIDKALHTAMRLMQEGGAHMVKLEGGVREEKIVTRLTQEGVPVCAHIGLRPQLIHKLGGYRVQGRDDAAADQMLEDALALQEAGADAMLMECVTAPLAAKVTEQLNIPVIGIGAGADCDGQILVLQDILGITPGRVPKFAANFLDGQESIQAAVEEYVDAVKSGRFPAIEHTFIK